MSSVTTEGFDPVKKATPQKVNEQIESETWNEVTEYQYRSTSEITDRIHELEKEWDIEKFLGVNMGTLALSGLAAGVFTKNRNWFALPAIVLGFFVQHSIQGWCPPLPLMRMFKIRTRKEIEQEKYALKWLRGDFNNLAQPPAQNVEAIKRAVTKS